MMCRNAAKQIKLLRIKHDLTQEKLAEKLGVSTKYISAIEKGKGNKKEKAGYILYTSKLS